MLTAALDGLVARFGLQDERLGEVAAGAVLKHSRDFNLTREAVLGSRLAPTTPAYDVQQACGTGLETAILVANKIALGQIESGIAGGVDTTSDAPIAVNEDLREVLLEVNRAKSLGGRGSRRSAGCARASSCRPSRRTPSRAPGCRWASTRRSPPASGASPARRRTSSPRPSHQQPRRRLRPRLLRRPDHAVPRPDPRPEPARRLVGREAGEAQAGLRHARRRARR